MAELNAKFSIEQKRLRVAFNLEQTTIPAIFKINAAGTTWGSIAGNIQNQTDLYAILQDKASVESVENLAETVQNNYNTLDTKIDDTESALAGQITALSDTVDINNQNINNRVDTVEETVSNLTDTVSDNYTELDDKISDNTDAISTINGTISGYGNIVTHNVNEFATAAQGSLADSALQPNDNISELNNDVGYITSASLPTVNNGSLTIQRNGSQVAVFTANDAQNITANILVPTQASDVGALPDNTTIADLTTQAQFDAINSGITNSDVSLIQNALQPNDNISELNNDVGYITSASLPTVNNGILDIQVNGTSIGTFTANQVDNTTANIVVPDSATWGNITGTLSNQIDLQDALDSKYDASNPNGYTSNVGTVTSVNNIQPIGGNITLLIPTATSDLTNDSGFITSSALAPYALSANLAAVATSGSYNDLSDKPTIPSEVTESTVSGWGFTKNIGTVTSVNNITPVNGNVTLTVDSALDSTSTNPVENRVIAQALEEISLAKNPNLNLIGGNLNIDSGNVSGFSTTDYMQFPFIFNFNNYHWTLEMGFITGADVTTQQNILDSYYGIAFAIRNGKFVLAISSNGSSWDIANTEGTYSVQANTAYSVKITWDGTNYTLSYALDETNYTTDITIASALVHNATQEYVGGEPDLYGGSQHPFTGTINLNNWKLIVNGLEVWLGMDDVGLGSRANIDLSNLTEAGQYMVDTVKDQNDGSRIKTWTGTKAQYDAIATKDVNTLYNITDDTDVTLTLLEALYPVGSIYIGTMANCPLATLGVGTWQLKTSRFLVDKYSNGTDWWELYSDGWCRQGGVTIYSSNWGLTTVNLNKTYNSLDYIISITGAVNQSEFSSTAGTTIRGTTRALFTNRTNNSFDVQSNNDVDWQTEGYTSETTQFNQWERIS